MITLWVIALYAWRDPSYDLSNRPLGSLTINEITHNVFWAALWFGPLALIIGRFVNYDGDIIDWEAWGRCGLWVGVIVAVGALWLAHG